jgi:hypothetical protein
LFFFRQDAFLSLGYVTNCFFICFREISEIKSPFSANSSSVNKALTSSLISANAAERSCLAEPAFATA